MPQAEPNQSAIGLLRLLLVASVLIPLLLFGGAAWLNYESAMAAAQRDLMRATEVAREHAARVFDGQSQVVDRVTDLVRGMDPATIRQAQKPLHEGFAAIIARLPQVQSVLLASRDGRPLVSAGTYPVPDVDLSGRDYFRAVVEGFSGTYITSLQVGDVNRQLFFGLARPWTNESGVLAGLVDVAVSPAFFQDFYRLVIGEAPEDAAGNVLTLMRDDGQVLVRYPPLPGPPPRAEPRSPFFIAIRARPDSGLYDSRSIVDAAAPARLYAYRKVQGFPLYVVAGRSRAEIVAGWRRTMAGHLTFGVPVTVALLAVTWTALVRTRREGVALARARGEMERRERAEAALLKTQRLEAVGQMTGGVAHDFNNLLTVILGSADLLGRRADDPARVRTIAGQIMLAAQHGARITQQLLTFARRTPVKAETVDVNALLQAFKQLLDRAASEAVQIELHPGPALRPVHLDPSHFEAAVLNLVGNARDAMPDGGRIVITTDEVAVPATNEVPLPAPSNPELKPGPYVRVAVTDEGCGMDAATAARVFEPFFTTKEVGRGTGLGLSQVYGFAKQAGGDVRITTAPGAGTTVELLLPAHDAVVAAPAPQPQTAEGGGGEVVLIVEDEAAVLAIVVESLQELGYATLTANSGRRALRCLEGDARVDLLFSDVVMPGGMNGLQLATVARRLRPGLKVLMTSGYTAGADAPDLSHSGLSLPDLPLLAKPYDRQQLAAALAAALAG